jgi:hypothetical protein
VSGKLVGIKLRVPYRYLVVIASVRFGPITIIAIMDDRVMHAIARCPSLIPVNIIPVLSRKNQNTLKTL